MLVVAMVLAACWGVLQLTVLGSATRTVRAGTLLLAVGAGVYGCGLFAVTVQYAWTRLYASASGTPVYQVVETASYTVDPFVEEVAKVLPLLVLAWSARARLQRGLTDHLLLGAATGAGFGLLEALMRFGSRAGTAVGMPGGWVLPISLSPPMVPSPDSTMTSWLPAPAGGDGLLAFGAGTGTNLHLAWSALAGLGVGLLVRGRGPVRLLGPLLVALAAAIVVDVRWLRRARSLAPDLRLRRERDTTGPGVGLAGYAVLGLPWTPLVIARFVGLRRSALYAVAPRPASSAFSRPAGRSCCCSSSLLLPGWSCWSGRWSSWFARFRRQCVLPAVRRPPGFSSAWARRWGPPGWLASSSPPGFAAPSRQRAWCPAIRVLDALSSLLLVAGVALVIAAFVFFPPSIGLVATTAGVLIPTIAVSGAFATTAGLGAMSILLSQAAAGAGADSSTGGGGDGGGAGGGEKPSRLSPAQRQRLGNLADDADKTVSEMIKLRGGGAGQVAQLETGYGQLTLREIARRAVGGDPQAIKALKMIKQAGTQGKGGK